MMSSSLVRMAAVFRPCEKAKQTGSSRIVKAIGEICKFEKTVDKKKQNSLV